MFQRQKLNKKHWKLVIALKSSGLKFYMLLACDFWLNVVVKLLPDIQPQKEQI